MTETETNQQALRHLMAWYGVDSNEVACMIHRSKGTVRQYMCGARFIKPELLTVLEIRCKERESFRLAAALTR